MITAASNLPYEQLDFENELMTCRVKLFIIPVPSKQFALYLAEREDEACSEHHRVYGELGMTPIDVSEKMDTSTYCEETKIWQSFRELKR